MTITPTTASEPRRTVRARALRPPLPPWPRPASRASSWPTRPSATCVAPRASSTTGEYAVELAESARGSRTCGTSCCSATSPTPPSGRLRRADRPRRVIPRRARALRRWPPLVPRRFSELATGLALIGGALGLRPMLDLDAAQRLDDALTLVAVVPTLVAALHRLGPGLVPIEPIFARPCRRLPAHAHRPGPAADQAEPSTPTSCSTAVTASRLVVHQRG